MPYGTPADEYVEAVRKAMCGAGRGFDPDFVLVSAGYDAAAGDMIGVFDLAPDHYRSLTQIATEVAAQCCDGRLLSVLEGGYNLRQLADCAAAHVDALLESNAT